jgi:hypothetical protein
LLSSVGGSSKHRAEPAKVAEAQLIRTTLQARQQIVATLLQIQGSIRGLL